MPNETGNPADQPAKAPTSEAPPRPERPRDGGGADPEAPTGSTDRPAPPSDTAPRSGPVPERSAATPRSDGGEADPEAHPRDRARPANELSDPLAYERPPRDPSQFDKIMDPRLRADPATDAHFRGKELAGHDLGRGSDRTAAVVTVDGRLPKSVAERDDVRQNPANAVRFSDRDGHAEQHIIKDGDLRNAVRDAAESSLESGDRSTVRVIVNRSPCHSACSHDIPRYVTEKLPGEMQKLRPKDVTPDAWDAALRRVDIEVHAPHAYEGTAGPTTTEDLLRLERAGVQVHVYQPAPDQFRPGGTYRGGRGGASGAALNDSLRYLDDHLDSFDEPPTHWTNGRIEPPNWAPVRRR